MSIGETGTKKTPPVKGPARSTSSDWEQPNTRPQGEDKAGVSGGVVENVGKNAGRMSGQKQANVKIW
jgi:hypothetical protein